MRSLLFTLLLISASLAGTMDYYAVGKLSSPAVSAKIKERFKAEGEPLFLIHDSKSGVSVGDFIKFKDKIVLIDGQVWQTLAAEKVFTNMEKIAVTTLKGSSRSSEWSKKSKLVKTGYSRKSYILGSEILKIFEEQFSRVPKNESVIITFNNGRATLVVPNQLINSLSLQRVTKSNKTGKMIWTTPTCEFGYINNPFSWQVWAADPAEPSGSISYKLSGTLPKGVNWNKKSHTLEGTPEDTGSFPIGITAISVAQSIVMNCTLSVFENNAPAWANVPDTIRVGEKEKLIPIILSDIESPGRDLSVEVSTFPPGLSFIDSLTSFKWVPLDSNQTVGGYVALVVKDPMGDSSEYTVPLTYEADGEDVGYTFASLTPPWDTLVEGVTYEWNLSTERIHWKRNHLQMKLGKCSDTTYLSDTMLVMKPGGDSLFNVTFRFRDRSKEITQYEMKLPVIPNRAPYFEAFPDRWDIEIHDIVFFTPKASDPEGEEVDLRLRSADSGFVYIDGRLSFAATAPGTYQAFLEAEDEFGNISVQQVTYYVKKVYDTYRGVSFESGVWPGKNSWRSDSWGFMNPWRFHWEVPALRFGFFVPDDCNLRDTSAFRFPFVYVGTDFMPADKRAMGKSVAADLGFSYNITTREIHTFGLYLNLEAKAPVEALFRSELDVRFLFFARHLLRKVSVNHTINDDGTLGYDAVKDLNLLEEFISTNNINLFMGGSQWFHLGAGVFLGPTFQARIAPVAMTMEEVSPIEETMDPDSLNVNLDQTKNIYSAMAGLAFRHDLKLSKFRLENKVRCGYAGSKYGWMVYWDCALGFGYFKR